MQETKDTIKDARCLNTISKFVPIIKWLPKYTQLDAVSDLIAGITLGFTMIPQSIAYAVLAGLTSQYGLYSAFAGSLVYIIFGTIKEVSIGPTSLMALLTLEFTHDMPIDFVVLLSFIAGCVELLMGLLNLGFLVDLISMPVTSGFTSATSVIIIIGQLQGLLGLKYKAVSNIDNIIKIFQHISDIRVGDTLVGVSSIIFLLIFRKINNMNICCRTSEEKGAIVKKSLWVLSIGRNALLIFFTTVIAYMLDVAGKSPFLLSGKVKSGLPSFSLPPFGTKIGNETYTFIDMCTHLGTGIIVVPLVAVLANVSIAKAFASGKSVDASQEMRTLGLCNILGGFIHSMPTCGAFTRSAVSNTSGVQTPLAGLYAGIMTLLALSFLTPYFYYIPRASLSAVLISAVVFMIDWSIVTLLWKGSKKDMVATVGTFLICILLTVEVGLVFGIILNILYLLHAWARPSIHVTKYKVAEGEKYILIKPDVGLYYPAIDFLRTKVNEVASQEGKNVLPVVLDCESFKGIDYTAIKGIEAMAKDFERKGQGLLFLRINEQLLTKIETLASIKKLRHATSENDIACNLFGESYEMSRSATVPILREVEDETAAHSGAMKENSQNDESEHSKGEKERESLLGEYEAVIKDFKTADKSQLKKPASKS